MDDETLLVHAGRDPESNFGVVNPPVYHASTIIYDTVDAYKRRKEGFYDRVIYGLYGTPTTMALGDAVAALEGGFRTVILSSGTAANSLALTAFLKAGDHFLITDSVYGTTRSFCDNVLARFGVEVTYYDPLIGGDIASLFRPETRVVFLESPGSLTFEIQDVPAIAKVARAHGAVSMIDNTWASPFFFKPIEHGVDVSIQAGTKYVSGHSDLMLGLVTAHDEASFRKLKDAAGQFGSSAGADDCYLALRGMRTLGVRMQRHQDSALAVAEWLRSRPEVLRVLHPALSEHPGHALWKRDFRGSSGLFGVLLQPVSEKAVVAMLEHMKLFKIGNSWGGYESLIAPAHPTPTSLRTATRWEEAGHLIRLHVGLENVDDLIADLEEGFQRLHGAR